MCVKILIIYPREYKRILLISNTNQYLNHLFVYNSGGGCTTSLLVLTLGD